MRALPNLELHLSHACNLACESCSHYSNQGHKGNLSLEEAHEWMSLWDSRVQPRTVSLLGGEPAINPCLPQFVALAARHWPGSRLRLVTNGFFLHRHPSLPLALKAHPDAFVSLSIHHDDPAYRQKLVPVIELLREWVRDHGIRVGGTRSHDNWTRRYHGFGAGMAPFEDGDPRQSWEHCPARYCTQLFARKLWKCGPITYLRLQGERYDLSPKWDPYLAYQPLEPGCTDAALDEFFGREEESCCSMCPARPERFRMPIPLRSVARPRASDQAEPAEDSAAA